MQLEEKGKIIIDEKTGTMKRVRRYLNGTKNSTEFHHEVIDLDAADSIVDPVIKGQAQALKANFVKPKVQ